MGRIFGTDGARGVAITELTCERAMEIGRAAAIVLTRHSSHKARLLIGKDTRISSDILEAALVAGITSVGADVEILGVVPTPAVAYLVTYYKADAGVMISASHNSVEYNGIKLFSKDGFKLSDNIEEEIEALILERKNEVKLAEGTDVGRVKYIENAVSDYTEHIRKSVFSDCSGVKAAFDCANGSASATADKLFSQYGAECLYISNTPDGTNINKKCGSTHIEALQKYVTDNKCDVGFAFDGDADRCLAVDENGKLVDGDKIIAVVSWYLKSIGKLNKDTAVVTVMSNLGFHGYMKKNSINTVCTKVGDRYVLEEMLKKGYNIGGEQSGHIIFLDHATTGDGELTAAMLLMVLTDTQKKLSELVADIEDYPQVLLNVKIRDNAKGKWKNEAEITSLIQLAKTTLGDDARILVRESGTEPLVRVMIEGKNEDDIKSWAMKIAEKVKQKLGR